METQGLAGDSRGVMDTLSWAVLYHGWIITFPGYYYVMLMWSCYYLYYSATKACPKKVPYEALCSHNRGHGNMTALYVKPLHRIGDIFVRHTY